MNYQMFVGVLFIVLLITYFAVRAKQSINVKPELVKNKEDLLQFFLKNYGQEFKVKSRMGNLITLSKGVYRIEVRISRKLDNIKLVPVGRSLFVSVMIGILPVLILASVLAKEDVLVITDAVRKQFA